MQCSVCIEKSGPEQRAMSGGTKQKEKPGLGVHNWYMTESDFSFNEAAPFDSRCVQPIKKARLLPTGPFLFDLIRFSA